MKSFGFHSWKETPTKDILNECTIWLHMMNIMKIAHDEHRETR